MTLTLMQPVRHELKFRICEVVERRRLTPNMIRVVIESPDLAGFKSLGFDDHIGLFFIEPEGEYATPTPGPNGMTFSDGKKPPHRHMTPRAFDPETNRLTIDVAEHKTGPAIDWARTAAIGSKVGVGGPRKSMLVNGDFDWHMLIGDDTALPAIGRRIEELAGSVPVYAIIEVPTPEDVQDFSSVANAHILWVFRNGADGTTSDLLSSVQGFEWPHGKGYVFVAGEASVAKDIRAFLIQERGQDPSALKAASYWREGVADYHEKGGH